MAFTLTLNGNTYTSDPAVVVEDGYRFDGYGYMKALPNLVVDLLAVLANYLTLTSAQADAAAQSAVTALHAPGTSATSTTSLPIGYGVKAFTIEPGKLLKPGMWLGLASAANAADNWMQGPIQSYDPVTGNTVAKISAIGTLDVVAADWIVFIAPAGGAMLGYNKYTGSQYYAAGIFEGYFDIGADSTVDLRKGSFFKKTVTGAWTLATINIPDGAAASFTLKVVGGGSAAMTLPAGSQFANGLVPTLSLTGTDRLHFIREPGGAWEVYLVGFNVKVPA